MKRSVIILAFLSFITTMKAQMYVSTNATVFIDSEAILSVVGDAKNDGTIENPGTIQLKGYLDNQNVLNSTGSFVLSGLNQTIYHKNNVLSTLICNGGGIKKLTNNITITKELDLNDGLLKPLDSTTLLLKSTANTSLGNTDSYVDGKLFTEGLSNRYFPIGKGGLFAPCELQSVKGDSIIVYGMDVVNPTSLTLTKGKLTQGVLQTRYWKMTPKIGTYKQANLSLSYSSDDTFANPDMIGVLQANDSVGPYDMLKKNPDVTSKISGAGLLYSSSSSSRPITKKYFTLGDYVLADMSLFYLPNALSKHALDSNDRAIRVYGDLFAKEGFSFVISNQWGNVVYKTTSVKELSEKGWDGTNIRTQKHETTGQYLYVLKGVTLDGEAFEKAGSIWIIE
jgi:hypothetical protein